MEIETLGDKFFKGNFFFQASQFACVRATASVARSWSAKVGLVVRNFFFLYFQFRRVHAKGQQP